MKDQQTTFSIVLLRAGIILGVIALSLFNTVGLVFAQDNNFSGSIINWNIILPLLTLPILYALWRLANEGSFSDNDSKLNGFKGGKVKRQKNDYADWGEEGED